MRTLCNALCVALLYLPVAGDAVAEQSEIELDSAGIVAFLSDREIKGNQNGTPWKQTFDAGGSTYYEETNGFRPGNGYWKAENNQYCSQWPPSDIWSCYRMTADGENLTFYPASGEPWPALRLEKK